MSKESWYRPVNRERYERNYNIIFGEKCDVCKGEGFLEDKDAKGKVIKTICLICGGSGKVKGE